MLNDKRILIIDDDMDDQFQMREFLRRAGFNKVSIANSGEEGILQAEAQMPDVVVTDTVLQTLDGFQVCQAIRKIDGASKIKIIVMTGKVDAVDADKARKSGANDYVVKTSDYGALTKALIALCK